MIYHTSDWHLDHQNIIEYDGRPDKTVEAMNARIISITNEHVTEKDLLIYQGDFCLPYTEKDDNDAYIAAFKKHLNHLRCQNIRFIAGNHDRTYLRRRGQYVPNLDLWDLFCWRKICRTCGLTWDISNKGCKEHPSEYHEYLNDYYPLGYELRITKRLCSEHDIPEQFDGTTILCTHYSHRVWNKSHRDGKIENLGKSINLYGHSHGSLPGIKNSFDVGFNIWNRPLSLVEILTDLMPKHNQSEEGKKTYSHHAGKEMPYG